MEKLLTIIGARPQIIKAAALNRCIRKQFAQQLKEVIVHTGQHYDDNMSEVFFSEMEIPPPDYNLNVGSGSHGWQTARMIEGIEEVLLKEKPDNVIIYGDTNSTLAGSVAAAKLNIPVIHIEAGLRSFNRTMPEEINRVTCDHLSTLLFSPTKAGFNNLLHEGFNANNSAPFTPENPGVFHCGDVMYDNSLFFARKAAEKSAILKKHQLEAKPFILATVHRNQNTDKPEKLRSIMEAFLKISEDTDVVLRLHPRTRKMLQQEVHRELYSRMQKHPALHLVPPVSFFDIIRLEQQAKMIITDSGGVQKEAYFFKKPCIILRPETEWTELVETGTAILANADYDKIIAAFKHFSKNNLLQYPEIFGDGQAAEFICETILANKV